MVDNFSTIFEQKFSPPFLPSFNNTRPSRKSLFPRRRESSGNHGIWKNFTASFHPAIGFVSPIISEGGGGGNCALPFGRSILNAFYLCNGALLITFQTGRYYDCIRLHNAFRRIPGLVTERRKNCTDVLPFSPFSTKNETPSPCYLPYTIRIYVFPSTIRLDRRFPLFLSFFVFTDKLGPRLIIESNKNSTRNTHTHTHECENFTRHDQARILQKQRCSTDISGIRAIPVISFRRSKRLNR